MSSQKYISDTLKQKKKNVRKVKTYLWLVAALLVLIGLIYVLRMPYIQITEVEVTGNAFVSTQEIKNETETILNSSILGFIPRRNIFIFSQRELEMHIKKNPAVVSVNIKKDFFNKLTVTIVEQEKEIIYCTSTDHTECLYINKTGFIYAKLSDFVIPEQEVIIYSELGQKHIEDRILDEKLYINVVSFIKSTTRYDIKIGKVYIKSDQTLEFVTRDGVRIITSIYDDFEKDFSNLIALFEKQILTKEQLPQIEYIDVRFGNKVFYKNKTN